MTFSALIKCLSTCKTHVSWETFESLVFLNVQVKVGKFSYEKNPEFFQEGYITNNILRAMTKMPNFGPEFGPVDFQFFTYFEVKLNSSLLIFGPKFSNSKSVSNRLTFKNIK